MSKVFVAYKYDDVGVQALPDAGLLAPTTARNYVNVLENLLAHHEYIYKGEHQNESLEGFKDETIASELRDRIFDSSVTLVLISKNMQEIGKSESDQWIPWEISYSLREKTREDRRSLPNACLAIVLPDERGSYGHFVQNAGCAEGCVLWRTGPTFEMISKNMFNRKIPRHWNCIGGHKTHSDNDHSYMFPVVWGEFVTNVDKYIDIAKHASENIRDYDLKVQI